MLPADFDIGLSTFGGKSMQIITVQEQLEKLRLDGWLLYDFQGLNPIARKLAGLHGNLLTRRWFYWIPRKGIPSVLCHRIEQHGFQSLEGSMHVFKSWDEMIQMLGRILKGAGTIAMEYSPSCSIPYVSRVDAGTLEMVRSFGVQVVSSANLIQYFEASWSRAQFQMHLEASRHLMQILDETFEAIRARLRTTSGLSEYELQQIMARKYEARSLFSFSPPIVAVNQNSANPHYEPNRESSSPIRRSDFLLIDFWAKLQRPESVYADYTWVAYLGEIVPDRYRRIWEVVKSARDATVAFVKSRYPREPIQGWQVDAIAREYIGKEGYGEFFIHRTGHNIGEEDHGNGANMDSLETKDERLLIPHTCFSIEPGIYLPEFGVRSELNVYLNDDKVVITGDPVQEEIVRIF
jgi:Xaa-Pro aminopeptidase